ncbi:MAG: hypothetical protein IH623_05105 [Verrucomicrobia bacterium]|nr:hypothetical protein [Verrucomicrobiota bacterium]
MGELADEGQHLFRTRELLAGGGRTANHLADWLLEWFNLVRHSGKLNPLAVGGQLECALDFLPVG